jgi:hypothetical protein
MTYYTISEPMEILKQQFILSNRERFDILEIRNRHRLTYFSYTYRITDKYGSARPIIRWDNFGGQNHYDIYDSNQHLISQKDCEYKDSRELLQLVKIFKHNLATMDLNQL